MNIVSARSDYQGALEPRPKQLQVKPHNEVDAKLLL